MVNTLIRSLGGSVVETRNSIPAHDPCGKRAARNRPGPACRICWRRPAHDHPDRSRGRNPNQSTAPANLRKYSSRARKKPRHQICVFEFDYRRRRRDEEKQMNGSAHRIGTGCPEDSMLRPRASSTSSGAQATSTFPPLFSGARTWQKGGRKCSTGVLHHANAAGSRNAYI
jgi:hypothetical protein